MRLPIPPSGRRQPDILRERPSIVKQHPKTRDASADAPPREPRIRRRAHPRSARRRRRAARRRRARRNARRHARREREPSTAALARAGARRPGHASTARAQLCIVAKLDLVTGTVQGHPDGFGFLVPDDGGDDLFLVAARDAQGAARRPRDACAHRRRPARPARRRDRRGARARATAKSSAACTRSTASGSSSPRTGASPGHPGPAGRARRREAGPGRRRRDHRAADARIASRSARVIEVLGNTTDPGMEIEIALRKHDLPHEFSKRGRARRRSGCPTEVRADGPQGPRRPARAAARHHRRRDREGFRRRGVLRAQGQGLPPDRRDRRRRRTTCATATRSTTTRASAATRCTSRAA